MNDSIPILVGPTGSGKTGVAIELARQNGWHVLSADSRQIYKGLRIGTAKPEGVWKTSDGLAAYHVEDIPHHLMDFLEPIEGYNAGLFARQAHKIIHDLRQRGKNIIVVGGTGLYLRALVDGLAPLPASDAAMRERIAARAEKEGRRALHAELARVDPISAGKIPPNNIARLSRALEVFYLTGRPLSSWHDEKPAAAPWTFQWFGLQWGKQDLERRLAERCRRMVEAGLLDETAALVKSGVPTDAPAFNSLGYPLAIQHLSGRISKQYFLERFFLQTRQYVKRQLTWFRADNRIHWVPVEAGQKPPALAAAISGYPKRR